MEKLVINRISQKTHQLLRKIHLYLQASLEVSIIAGE